MLPSSSAPAREARVSLRPAPLAPPPPAAEFASLTTQYCVSCHSDRLKTAGLSLQGLDLSTVPEHAEVWEKVMRKMRTGEMPPATVRTRPDTKTETAFASYLESSIDYSAYLHPNPGRTPVHRLNRAEYSNAIRDLLAVDVKPGEWLPVDDSGYGFDNIAAVLSTSPALLERYMSAGRKISRFAVGDLTLKPIDEIYDAQRDPVKGSRNEQLNEDLPFGSRAGMSVEHYFPVDAEYVFTLRFAGAAARVAGAPDDATDANSIRIPVRAGLHTVGATSPRENPKPEAEAPAGGRGGGGGAPAAAGGNGQLPTAVDLRLDGARVKRFDMFGGAPEPSRVIIGGPYKITGRGNTPSRAKIFICRPAKTSEEAACARRILTNLAHHAFRRPVTSADIEPIYAFYQTGRANGDFESGIEDALRAILVSPEFLFRIENDPPRVQAGQAYRVSDLELASRLSFFLWSSIPDDELLASPSRAS